MLHLRAALIGVFFAHWVHDTGLAAACAVATAIAVMFSLRCLHPPSGAGMRSEIAFATPTMPVIELARPMATGITCIPLIDETRVLLGAIYPSQLMGALHQLTLMVPERALPPALGATA